MAELAKELKAPQDKRTQQEKHFDEVYGIFYAFYQEKMRTANAPHQRVKLLLTTNFFDDVSLQKTIHPVFARYTTTVAEKQAIARMAFYDALTIHNATAGMVFKTATEKEKHDL